MSYKTLMYKDGKLINYSWDVENGLVLGSANSFGGTTIKTINITNNVFSKSGLIANSSPPYTANPPYLTNPPFCIGDIVSIDHNGQVYEPIVIDRVDYDGNSDTYSYLDGYYENATTSRVHFVNIAAGLVIPYIANSNANLFKPLEEFEEKLKVGKLEFAEVCKHEFIWSEYSHREWCKKCGMVK